jgi:hypothetical protein
MLFCRFLVEEIVEDALVQSFENEVVAEGKRRSLHIQLLFQQLRELTHPHFKYILNVPYP